MVENDNKTNNKNNIIKITNNNVKYYENLALQHSKDSAKSATKSASYANDAKSYMNSCQLLKNTIDDETVQIVKLHSDNTDNPHNVTSSQVNAYSKVELDNLLAKELSKKNQKLKAGENIIIIDNEDGSQTIKSANTVSLNYELSENKPLINGVVLNGSKSSSDLELASINDIPVKVSELENDIGYLTTHQDITGKQDVLSAGDGILLTDSAISVVNRANIDLSNLSDVGKKVIDGQWVNKIQILSSDTNIGVYTLDLSEYLPNDNYIYEVELFGHVRCDNSNPTTFIINDTYSIATKSSIGSLQQIYLTIPVLPTDRTIKKEIQKVKLTSTVLTAIRYRRIGTNE